MDRIEAVEYAEFQLKWADTFKGMPAMAQAAYNLERHVNWLQRTPTAPYYGMREWRHVANVKITGIGVAPTVTESTPPTHFAVHVVETVASRIPSKKSYALLYVHDERRRWKLSTVIESGTVSLMGMHRMGFSEFTKYMAQYPVVDMVRDAYVSTCEMLFEHERTIERTALCAKEYYKTDFQTAWWWLTHAVAPTANLLVCPRLQDLVVHVKFYTLPSSAVRRALPYTSGDQPVGTPPWWLCVIPRPEALTINHSRPSWDAATSTRVMVLRFQEGAWIPSVIRDLTVFLEWNSEQPQRVYPTISEGLLALPSKQQKLQDLAVRSPAISVT